MIVMEVHRQVNRIKVLGIYDEGEYDAENKKEEGCKNYTNYHGSFYSC